MSLTVSDLFTAQTSDQIRASMVTNLVSLGVPADKWRSGGVASTILTVCAMALAVTSAIIADLIKGFFLPTATGAALNLLATYVYGVTVPTATFASGTVTLTNGGGGSFTWAVGELTVQNASTKVTYTNDSAVTLLPSGTATCTVIAKTSGSGGNAAPGAISVMVTAASLVTVTNATALVGVDAPTDEELRTLCLNKLGALSVRGVRTAYAYAIQTAVNSVTGAPVNINRWSVTSASHTGDVTVVVAAPGGAPDANDVTGVATNIEAIARPEAVTVSVLGATTVGDTNTITIWCKVPEGVSSSDVLTACNNALIDYFENYPIGGETANDDAHPTSTFTGLFASGVYGELAQAVASLGGTLISAKGATDIALGTSQVVTDGVTVTVRILSPTSGTTVL